MTIQLIQGDCLEVMQGIHDNAADLVLTSPPYNMNLRIRNGEYCSRQIVKEISTKYTDYDDNMTMEEYFTFNQSVIHACLRLAPLVFYNVQFLTGNKVALFKLIGAFAEQLKEVIIWDKVNAQPAISDGVMNSQYEVILVFDRNNAISRKFENAFFDRGTLSNCWAIKRGDNLIKGHGAVFPIELAEKVIQSFSKKGQTIFDPFMGTGTTGVMAKKMERHFIGIEQSPFSFKIAEKRISIEGVDQQEFCFE